MSPSATYRTKGFIKGSTLMWIAVISILSLQVMFVFIFLGLHPFLLVALFIGTIWLGFSLVTGTVTYEVSEEGIRKSVEPNMLKNLWSKHTEQFYPWSVVGSFRTGRDTNRSLEEFEYLTVFIDLGPKLEINTKKGDSEAFREFEQVFRRYAQGEDRNWDTADRSSATMAAEGTGEVRTAAIDPGPVTANRPVIKEKPDFYRTFWAKFLTWCFIAMTIGIVALMITLGNSRPANIFRLLFIIVPGTIYMVWRVYFRKD